MNAPIVDICEWEVAGAPAGSLADATAASTAALEWLPARVPGTVAGALRDAGRWNVDGDFDIDALDWWFRTAVELPEPAALQLRFGGVATVAEVWVNGRAVLETDNMFVAHDVVHRFEQHNEIVVCCRSLRQHLAVRRPRPRWKTRLVNQQQLRWVRTSLLGRMQSWTPPAPVVGLWRPVQLRDPARDAVRIVRCTADHDGVDGLLELTAVVAVAPRTATVTVGGSVAPLAIDTTVGGERGAATVAGTVRLPGIAPWSPATHGDPALHDVVLDLETDAGRISRPIGRVGFRDVSVDERDGAFALAINGVDVFCRGACWVPLDVVTLQASPEELRAILTRARDAGLNMVRVTGTTVYESDAFYDLCDELGIMVWQDFMFANMEYPFDAPDFRTSVEVEVQQQLRRLARHPSVVVLCGGSEVEQQAAMMGVTREMWSNPLANDLLRDAVGRELPHAVFVSCSPSGGDHPFSPNHGVAHYYGVGAYRRPLADARLAGVRFASECLAFANVPTRSTTREVPGYDQPGTSPRWKARVPRDAGAGWDFDDVRDHYVRTLFGVDPVDVRSADPDRYLDLGRAAVHIAIESTISEWRRPGSSCAGALVFVLRDLWPSPGWGVLDHHGQPKAAFHALARASAPTALLLTDEGLNGLHAHVVHDQGEPFSGIIRAEVFAADGACLTVAEAAVTVPAHGAVSRSVDGIVGGFRDLTYAYRFGPPVHDVIAVQLLDERGVVSSAHHLPGGYARSLQPDLGLRAAGRVGPDGLLTLCVETDRFAEFVAIEVDGFAIESGWFHLAPGHHAVVRGTPVGERCSHDRLSGEVRALNLIGARAIEFSADAAR